MKRIKQLRDQVDYQTKDFDDYKTNLYYGVVEIANVLEVPEALPSRVKEQDIRNYYYQTYWIPCMEQVVAELDKKFDNHTESAMQIQLLIPARMKEAAQAGKVDKESLVDRMEEFPTVIGASRNPMEVDVGAWIYHWTRGDGAADTSPPNNALEALDGCASDFFPTVAKMLQVEI